MDLYFALDEFWSLFGSRKKEKKQDLVLIYVYF